MQTMILAVALAGALLVAGCGGGSKGASMAGMPSGGEPSTPTPTTPPTYGPGRTIPLPTGHTLQTGTTIPAGESRSVGEADGERTTIRCTAGSENCRFTVAADGTVTLIAGSLRIEIVGIRITPPTRVIESPLVERPPVSRGELPSWGELPALVDRMNHRTQIRSVRFRGPSSCDDGVAACQAVVKNVLAVSEYIPGDENRQHGWFHRAGVIDLSLLTPDQNSELSGLTYGYWLENSIFMYTMTYDTYPNPMEDPERIISMGIRDTTPVTGVYRGWAMSRDDLHPDAPNFELTYTSGTTGGQLDMTIDNTSHDETYTWTNVSVDNEGHFDNGITPNDRVLGANKLEGSFYQGGEVGGVYSYRPYDQNYRSQNGDAFYGAFGGKLVPASP